MVDGCCPKNNKDPGSKDGGVEYSSIIIYFIIF